MNKRLILPGGILWILGLVLSIVGLGIVGAAWFMARRSAAAPKEEEKQEE